MCWFSKGLNGINLQVLLLSVIKKNWVYVPDMEHFDNQKNNNNSILLRKFYNKEFAKTSFKFWLYVYTSVLAGLYSKKAFRFSRFFDDIVFNFLTKVEKNAKS